MSATGLSAPPEELRDGEMIRAYLDEIARLKSPVRLWIAGSQGVPFETTLEKVSPIAFSTTTTPKLDQGQILAFSFMLDGHRFTCSARVVSPGVFKIPLSIVRGERRAQYRVPFERDRVSVFAVESLADTVLGGRTLLGRLVDLSPQGLRVVLEDVGTLGSGAPAPKAGDCYSQVCLQGLPLTPAILCRGVVVHLAPDAEEPYAGLRLEGLAEVDRKHLDRLLTPRVPASFGEHFPHRKRKTDFADRLGAPTSSRRRAKAPEMVDRVLEGAPPPPPPEAPPVSPAMRLRKASKKVLFLSTHPETPIMAESLRQDGFKQVFEARSYQEARILAERVRFDLVILDLRVGGHWGRDIMTTLASQGLLIQVPIILMVDYRNDAVVALAMEIGAATIHERHRTGDMLPVVHGLLLG